MVESFQAGADQDGRKVAGSARFGKPPVPAKHEHHQARKPPGPAKYHPAAVFRAMVEKDRVGRACLNARQGAFARALIWEP
jgi:hypothetical protein